MINSEHVVLVAPLDAAQVPKDERRHVHSHHHTVESGRNSPVPQSLLAHGFFDVRITAAVAQHECHRGAALRIADLALWSSKHSGVASSALAVVVQDDVVDLVLVLAADFDAVAVKAAHKDARLQLEGGLLSGDVQKQVFALVVRDRNEVVAHKKHEHPNHRQHQGDRPQHAQKREARCFGGGIFL